MVNPTPLWTPSEARIAASRMVAFEKFVNQRFALEIEGFDALHQWSIENDEAFWDAVWDFCGVLGEKGGRILENPGKMPGTKFFPDAQINYAENELQNSGSDDAIVFRGEDKVRSRLSWDELRASVSSLQQALKAAGVKKGDRVAAMLPNMAETVAAFLATVSLGAIWSSCSPDFGEQGVLDRFGQIEPKVFIAVDGYWYNGKKIDVAEKVSAIVDKLGSPHTLIVSYLGEAEVLADRIASAGTFDAAIAKHPATDLFFERVPFDHPLYILFSSGTTGIPKCIVHCHGGALLQHLKEQQIHCGLGEGDRFFYFTTCGWMMWNWLVSGLASGCTLMLYDGSPFAPGPEVLFDYAQDEKFTFFGTSAKFIDAVRNSGLRPIESHDLTSVQTITSTGSPLAPENFSFVYSSIKEDIHLASISGGTDIVSCFVEGVPTKPVYIGQIQGPSLGMATEVWSDEGKPVFEEKGELVCAKPFPSMPVMFWNDPDGSKYHAAYFERFENVWCHGDFAEWTAQGGMIIHGRSDATLNPGGVRIGTAEIYNQVEQMPEIEEALCIGQEWEGDVRVILFVRLSEGAFLDDALIKAIKTKIRVGASPRHVPAKVIAVSDIPRTKSGKITELAVRDVVHGRSVKNQEALANPDALKLFESLPELET